MKYEDQNAQPGSTDGPDMPGYDHTAGATSHERETPESGSPERTGPVGRTVRLLMAAGLGWLAAQWIEAGPSWFSQPSTAANPWVWMVTALVLYTAVFQVPAAGPGRRWVRRAVTGLAVVAAVAAVAAVVESGALWATPLTELLYGADVTFLVIVSLAHLVSVALGTPGCELAAVAELTRRVRGAPSPQVAEPMWCVAGLHRLDQWEAHQSWRANR